MKKMNSKTNIKPSIRKILMYFAAYFLMIVFWEIMMYIQIAGSLSGFSFFTVLFAIPEALILTSLSGFLKNVLAEKIVDIGISVLVLAYYITQTVYFQIFGSVLSITLIGVGGDAVTDFSWVMGSVIKGCIGIVLIMLMPIICWCIIRLKYLKNLSYKPIFHLAVFISAILLWVTTILILPIGGKEEFSAYGAFHGNLVDADTSSQKLGVLTNTTVEAGSFIKSIFVSSEEGESGEIEWNGEGGNIIPGETENETETEEEKIDTSPNIISAIDFEKLAGIKSNSKIKSLIEYCKNSTGTNKNEYTGIFKGYNLIYICAEGWSNYAVDPVVTPTMYRLANEGIVLDNYYNCFKNTTTNGEFALLTGLLPDVSRDADCGQTSGSFFQTSKNLMPMGLGTVFTKQAGVTSRGYHNFKGYYYGRNKTLPNLGFACKFMNAGMSFTTSWPSSDDEMFRQSVADYINDSQFLAYYMTFSGHGPYSSSNKMYTRNIDKVKELTAGKNYPDKALGYLATNYELEKGLTYLMEELEKAGKLENTVIVMAGDHYPYYLDANARNAIAGHKTDTAFEMYKSNCAIWCGGIKEPIHVDSYCSNIDIFPTIMNLFGFEYDSRLIAGNDIFSNAPHVAMLQNKSFVTEYVKYNSTNGKAEWSENVPFSDEEKKTYLKSIQDYVSNKFAFSLNLVDANFYKFVWENSGLS